MKTYTTHTIIIIIKTQLQVYLSPDYLHIHLILKSGQVIKKGKEEEKDQISSIFTKL